MCSDNDITLRTTPRFYETVTTAPPVATLLLTGKSPRQRIREYLAP
jgi:hypothetical protein